MNGLLNTITKYTGIQFPGNLDTASSPQEQTDADKAIAIAKQNAVGLFAQGYRILHNADRPRIFHVFKPKQVVGRDKPAYNIFVQRTRDNQLLYSCNCWWCKRFHVCKHGEALLNRYAEERDLVHAIDKIMPDQRVDGGKTSPSGLEKRSLSTSDSTARKSILGVRNNDQGGVPYEQLGLGSDGFGTYLTAPISREDYGGAL